MDFVGHIGGDDFFMLFQSPDWEQRCRKILAAFDSNLAGMLSGKILADGGYEAEDRRGNMEFHPFPALSIGVVQVAPGRFAGHYEVSTAAMEVKKWQNAHPVPASMSISAATCRSASSHVRPPSNSS